MIADHGSIVERIVADHRAALERIATLEDQARNGRDGSREPVFASMRADLLAHLVAEEEFVYLLLEMEMREWIADSRREHDLVRDHLLVLAAGGMPAPAWLDRLRAMRGVLEAHITEEERAVLPHLEMGHDLERLRDLGDEYARWVRESR